MRSENPVFEIFFRTWIEQFGCAVEMFTGTPPVISLNRTDTLPFEDSETALWWKQAFAGESEFVTWIGAAETTWTALGEALGESAPESCRSTYLELLSQAQHGTANTLSSEPLRTIRCQAGEKTTAPDPESLVCATVFITIGTTQKVDLFVALEAKADKVLEYLTASAAPGEPCQPQSEKAVSPMLGRLLTLMLPVSVAVGRAEMTIREVLEVQPGSLVDLNKEAGDSVELLIHGTAVARGEVVFVNGNYGIRISELVSRRDRLTLCCD